MDVASGPIGHALTNRLLAWMLSRRTPEARRDPETGSFLLGYGRAAKGIAAALTALALLLLLGSVLGTLDDPRALALCASIFGLLTAGALWALHDAFAVRILIDEHGLARRGALGGGERVPWSEITGVRWSDAMSWLVFRSDAHPPIRVSVYRNGLATLARLARKGLGEGPAAESVARIEAVAANPR